MTEASSHRLPFDRRDVAVIGGGQAGLALGYHLMRTLRGTDASFAVLDDQPGPGGAWRRGWDSLRLFSPAEASSLPGYLLPRHLGASDTSAFPHRDEVLDYLATYEERYALPVERPVRVMAVRRAAGALRVETDRGAGAARAVVCATGTASRPFIPHVSGRGEFGGVQVHSAAYRSPAAFAGQRVLVVGGGNSGAQIAAELSDVAAILWSVERAPRFLPPEVDGRVLFDAATARYHAARSGPSPGRPPGLGDIVQVPAVRAARASGGLSALRPPPARFTADGVVWPDGRHEAIDAVVWCTGFRAALGFLDPLGVREAGRVAVRGTRSVVEPGLWLVGYGEWTGFASATLVGVGRSARETAREVAGWLGGALKAPLAV